VFQVGFEELLVQSQQARTFALGPKAQQAQNLQVEWGWRAPVLQPLMSKAEEVAHPYLPFGSLANPDTSVPRRRQIHWQLRYRSQR